MLTVYMTLYYNQSVCFYLTNSYTQVIKLQYKIQNTKYKYANMEICKYAKYAKYKIQNTKYKIQNTKYKTNTIALSRGCQINDEHCIYVVDVL